MKLLLDNFQIGGEGFTDDTMMIKKKSAVLCLQLSTYLVNKLLILAWITPIQHIRDQQTLYKSMFIRQMFMYSLITE